MKNLLSLTMLFFCTLSASAQSDSIVCHKADTTCHEVMLETTMGNIRIMLYNETPLHRDNFLKVVKAGIYDGVIFHRVINKFMIQGGDPTIKTTETGKETTLIHEDRTDLIPAEFRYPKLFHKRGAIAAARASDQVNPQKMSSKYQFYIVTGKTFNDRSIETLKDKYTKHYGKPIEMTPEVENTYKTVGGTPHLDDNYTVYGEVIEGMDVVDSIQKVDTDENDRPKTDIKIIKAYIFK